MTEVEAAKEVERLWKALRDHCNVEIAKIEALCDKHKIVKYFNGLPPFDEHGNSGYYLPVNPENGESWLPSCEIKDSYGYNAEAGSWVSSSERC